MVIIINGKGGCGKDTLIAKMGHIVLEVGKYLENTNFYHEQFHLVENFSAVDKIKEIAAAGGWDNDKSDKGRKFLHDLKMLFVAYNDLPIEDLKQKVLATGSKSDPIGETICFVHCREPEEIKKAVTAFRELNIKTTTVLVKRDVTDSKSYGNHADDDVEKYNYEYIFINNDDIETSVQNFKELIKGIAIKMLYADRTF